MKLFSVFFLGLLFFAVFAPQKTLAQVPINYYLGVVDGDVTYVYKVFDDLSKIQIGAWRTESIFGDTISSALLCKFLNTEIECRVYTGISDSSGGSTRRFVGQASFINDGSIVEGPAINGINYPGNFFGLGASELPFAGFVIVVKFVVMPHFQKPSVGSAASNLSTLEAA